MADCVFILGKSESVQEYGCSISANSVYRLSHQKHRVENETIYICISKSQVSIHYKEMWRDHFVNCTFWPNLDCQQLFVTVHCAHSGDWTLHLILLCFRLSDLLHVLN